MTRWSAITPTRGRRSTLAYGSRSTPARGNDLNRLIHHDRGRYFSAKPSDGLEPSTPPCLEGVDSCGFAHFGAGSEVSRVAAFRRVLHGRATLVRPAPLPYELRGEDVRTDDDAALGNGLFH